MATPPPNLIFNLVPENEAAEAVVSHTCNAPFKHTNLSDGTVSLGIGTGHVPKNEGQLISFGIDPVCCDIVLPYGRPKQCHFSIHPRTCELLLHDDSDNSSTALLSSPKSGESTLSLPRAQHRQRVVLASINNARICISNSVFRLAWSRNRGKALEDAQRMRKFSPDHAYISTPLDLLENGRITHKRIKILGEGASAKVYLTRNLKTGDHLAVKVYKFEDRVEEMGKDAVRKEVNLIESLHHPHIALFKHAQGWELGSVMEVFMEAYQGSLWELLCLHRDKIGPSRQPVFFPTLMKQMLSALVYLDTQSVIHRDVKMDNILYDNQGNFYLADFGLSKEADRSNTLAGSPEFIAPEIFEDTLQTTKMDVWGIGMVALFVLNIRPLHTQPLTMNELENFHAEWFASVLQHVTRYIDVLLPMFQINPEQRFSARECLDQLFDPRRRDWGIRQRGPTLQSAARQDASHSRSVTPPPQVSSLRANVNTARPPKVSQPTATPTQQGRLPRLQAASQVPHQVPHQGLHLGLGQALPQGPQAPRGQNRTPSTGLRPSNIGPSLPTLARQPEPDPRTPTHQAPATTARLEPPAQPPESTGTHQGRVRNLRAVIAAASTASPTSQTGQAAPTPPSQPRRAEAPSRTQGLPLLGLPHPRPLRHPSRASPISRAAMRSAEALAFSAQQQQQQERQGLDAAAPEFQLSPGRRPQAPAPVSSPTAQAGSRSRSRR